MHILTYPRRRPQSDLSKNMLRAADDPGMSRADRRREVRDLLKGRKRKTHTGTTRNAWNSRITPHIGKKQRAKGAARMARMS